MVNGLLWDVILVSSVVVVMSVMGDIVIKDMIMIGDCGLEYANDVMWDVIVVSTVLWYEVLLVML